MTSRVHGPTARSGHVSRWRGRRSALARVVAASASIVAACADGSGDGTAVTAPSPVDGDVNGRIHGTVVIPSADSLTTWRPSSGVRVEVAVRDASARLDVVAAVSTDAAGRFTFPALDAPAERLFLRATPVEPGYRPTRWLAASDLRAPWGTYTVPGADGAALLTFTPGPYVVLERAGAPELGYAPILLMGHVLRPDASGGVAGARVVLGRTSASGADVVASARSDADGFFLVQLPDVGRYIHRVSPPPGSPFAERPPQDPAFAVAAFPDVTASNYLVTEVRAR
jgi:hypothetical protein